MTQVFADDQGQIPIQAAYRPPPALGPALMPGKGVRPIRCVGCSRDTLPRHDDGAPLCQRCSEVLAGAGSGVLASSLGASITWPIVSLTPRWLRRRPLV